MDAIPRIAAQLLADLSGPDVIQVLDVFAGELGAIETRLLADAAARDGAAFRRSAHALAGAASAVGAASLERAARAAMSTEPGGDLAPVAANLVTLAHEARDESAHIAARIAKQVAKAG